MTIVDIFKQCCYFLWCTCTHWYWTVLNINKTTTV